MEARTSPHRGTTSFGRAIGIGAALSIVVGLIVLAFAWPSVTAEPKDLPVAIVGADAAVEQVESRITEESEGAIALERVDDRDAAVAAIERRDAYGAIVLGGAPTDPLRVSGWLTSGNMKIPLSPTFDIPVVRTVNVFESGTDSTTNSPSVARGLPPVILR